MSESGFAKCEAYEEMSLRKMIDSDAYERIWFRKVSASQAYEEMSLRKLRASDAYERKKSVKHMRKCRFAKW